MRLNMIVIAGKARQSIEGVITILDCFVTVFLAMTNGRNPAFYRGFYVSIRIVLY